MRPFGSGSSDEDPYSVAGSGSSGGSSGNGGGRLGPANPINRQSDRPPKLPPRDTQVPASKVRDIYGPSLWAKPAVPAIANLKKTPKKSTGGKIIRLYG